MTQDRGIVIVTGSNGRIGQAVMRPAASDVSGKLIDGRLATLGYNAKSGVISRRP